MSLEDKQFAIGAAIARAGMRQNQENWPEQVREALDGWTPAARLISAIKRKATKKVKGPEEAEARRPVAKSQSTAGGQPERTGKKPQSRTMHKKGHLKKISPFKPAEPQRKKKKKKKEQE